MLVWCIDNRSISSRYRDIEVVGQCFHIDGCLSIEWDDTPDRTIYRPSIVWSFDIRYIEVSWYHQVSISTDHKYRDTSIYRVSNQHYLVGGPECRTPPGRTVPVVLCYAVVFPRSRRGLRVCCCYPRPDHWCSPQRDRHPALSPLSQTSFAICCFRLSESVDDSPPASSTTQLIIIPCFGRSTNKYSSGEDCHLSLRCTATFVTI